jgi:hypothetical protein
LLGGDADGGVLNFDDPAASAALNFGEESFDLFASLEDLDLDGQMVGYFEDVGGVDAMGGAEAGDAFEDGCAVDAILEEEIEEAGVDGDAEVPGSVAKVDGEFDGWSGGEHGRSFCRKGDRSIRAPGLKHCGGSVGKWTQQGTKGLRT